uniref:RHD domain-containing protein n=1 Tax=Glossina pallidipes TaxID=7398 RepID=A0A1A9ZVF8_GLOPL
MQENQQKPYVEIVEQPNKALRFRYECEGRYASCIPGISSTPGYKTHPEIRIIGYKGPAVVIVSCVTKEEPYRPHPHRLVGLKCSGGIFHDNINEDTMSMRFNHLGIQCVRKKDIEEALKEREERMVDPFKTGFSHQLLPHGIDLSAVRLYVVPGYLHQKRQRINPTGDPKYHLMNNGNGSVTYLNPINMQCQQPGVNPNAQPEISFDNFGNMHNRVSTVQTANALDNFNQQAQCGGNNVGMNAVFCPQMFNDMSQFSQTAQYNMTLQNAGAANSPMLSDESQNIAVGSKNDPSQMNIEGLQQILQNQMPVNGLSNLSIRENSLQINAPGAL